MSESNHVYENFEDALFRLIMDRVAVVEGERLLRENEKLKSDPVAAVPDKIQNRCLKTISNTFSKTSRKNVQKTAWKVARVLIVAATIIMLLGIAAFALIPSFRTGILNVLLTYRGDHMEWQYALPTDSASIQDIDDLWFSLNLPKDYSIKEYALDQVQQSVIYRNTEDSSLFIQVIVTRGKETTIATDIEDVDYYEEFMLNENDYAVLTEKAGVSRFSQTNTTHECFISIVANGLTPQELLELAKNIEFRE